MPLTALAYTAIDRIAGQPSAIVDALLVYIDTDTLKFTGHLSYRMSSPCKRRSG